MDNLYTQHSAVSREQREGLLAQKGIVLWFTGLSGSGKSTLADALNNKLFKEGKLAYVLDGDNIRQGLNKDLSFSDSDRTENIRRIAEVSKLFINCGVITINSFVSPTEKIRGVAKAIIGQENFIEIFVNTPLEVCESRDTKGLYAKARKGEVKNFTGISAPFESPENPIIVVKTENQTVEESANFVLALVLPIIKA